MEKAIRPDAPILAAAERKTKEVATSERNLSQRLRVLRVLAANRLLKTEVE